MRVAELCAGYGGLHLSMLEAGWPVELAWYAENDPDASAVMAAHHPGVLNVGDITTADWRRSEPVDIVASGYPCTDISNAGKRAGIEGAKSGIWRNVADAVRVLRPRLVVLENVRAHLARGFGRVLGDLAELGYDATWTCLRASDVGAPHQRDRVFILASPADPDGEPLRIQHVPVGARLGASLAGVDREDDDGLSLLPTPTSALGRGSGLPSTGLAQERRDSGRRMLDDAVALLPTPAARDSGRGSGYTDEPGRPLSETVFRLLPTPTVTNWHGNDRNYRGDLLLPGAVALLPTPAAKDSQGGPRAIKARTHGGTDFGPCLRDVVIAYADRWAQYGPAIRRWETVTGRSAPEPTITGKRGGQRLSGRFVEWMMGLPAGWVTDVVNNNSAVRICGNGLVPAQGAAAYSSLAVTT